MSSEEPPLSFRSVENSLQRFKESLPPLYTRLRRHVAEIRDTRTRGDIIALNREQIAASKTFKSLNHYLKELDEVENRLNYDDQLKFRGRVQSLRQEAYDEIVAFVELDNSLDSVEASQILNDEPQSSQQYLESEDGIHPELSSLQAEQRAGDDLKELEAASKSWNELQIDIQDVAEIMSKLSEMVHSQKQELNSIEQHVELAKERTSLGLLELIRARRAKFAAVPVVGAVVGCLVGGPVGMLAGFKVAGVLTAALGSYAGYRGGRLLKNHVNSDLEPDFIPGLLEAPTLGAYQDEVLTDDSGDFESMPH